MFASPAGFHFCLETKAKQKIQDLIHFLTVPRIQKPKQAQTRSMLKHYNSNMPLFLTVVEFFTPKM